MSDLPQRLRDRAVDLDRFSDEELVLEAADALEAQAKEITELRAALTGLVDWVNRKQGREGTLQDVMDRAEALLQSR